MNWLYILFALQVADIATTIYVLNRGGRELNPVLNKLFVRYGARPVLLVMKIGFIALVYWLADYGYLPLYGVQILAGFYALLIAWNVYQISK